MEMTRVPKSRLFGSDAAARAARRFGWTVMCVTLLVTAAFGSGVYWNQLHAQGTPAHARMMLPSADQELGEQMMFRMWEDIVASIQVYREQAELGGWRGEDAAVYLKNLREEAAK